MFFLERITSSELYKCGKGFGTCYENHDSKRLNDPEKKSW